jgi:hypothetical protein
MTTRKLALAWCALLLAAPLAAEELIEDFENVANTAYGTCAQLPAGWGWMNLDLRTPSNGVSWVTQGWCVTGDPDRAGNQVAVSNSWYSPEGAADDWIYTPEVQLGIDPVLYWAGESQDDAYLETYEIRISLGLPTLLDFDDEPILAQIANEPGDVKTPHRLELALYAGETVYIAWRNVSNDKFLLFIDDVRVVDEIFVNGFEGSEACDWETNDPYC